MQDKLIPTATFKTVQQYTKKVPWQCMQLHKGIIKSVSLPLETVRAGDHCDLKISRQILPLLFIFG